MSIFDTIKAILSGNAKTTAPTGYCPNCWGEQQYDGKFREILEQENVDLNNIDQKKGWIQALAAKKVEGLKLKRTGDLYECPTCKTRLTQDLH